MITKAFYCLALGLALTFTAAAQQGGGGQGGGGQGGGGRGGQQGGQQGGQSGQQGGNTQDPFGTQQDQMQQYRPIYLSGTVVMDTGEVPPEPVVIQRVCNGQNFPEGYSDSKGRFSFEVGGDPTVALTDASVGSIGGAGTGGRFGAGGFGGANSGFGGTMRGDGIMGVDLTGCEIRAELPGFQSDSIQLGRRRPLDNPDIGIIVLHSMGGVNRNSIVSVTTLEAPDKARSAYEKAMRELGKKRGKPDKALKDLEKAVSMYPNFAAAWSVLGSTRMKMGDMKGATEALEKAVAADPEYLRPYPDLVQIHIQNKNWERTSALSDAMLALNPGQTQVRYFKAVADYNLGDHEKAEATALEIQNLEESDRFPQTHQMLGMIASQRGQFEEAAKEYRQYLALAPDASSAEGIRKQLREWEVLGVIEPAAEESGGQE